VTLVDAPSVEGPAHLRLPFGLAQAATPEPVRPGGTSRDSACMGIKKVGVHNVHTLVFGFGCTGAGLSRIRNESSCW
jgi:hypothetical protein